MHSGMHKGEIVDELIPFVGSLRGQNVIWIFSNLMRLISGKVWRAVRIGTFCPKLRYFTDQNGPNGESHENEFWLFANTKMNATNS